MGNNFRILNAQVVYDLICKIGYNAVFTKVYFFCGHCQIVIYVYMRLTLILKFQNFELPHLDNKLI